MEGIQMLKDLLKPGDWMAEVNLKDAYFMLPIAQEDKEFLRFSWKAVTYQCNCLPFRLSSAPWVITKTIRPVVATLREPGLRFYMDDILIMAESQDLLRNQVMGLTFLLKNLGFVINYRKSQLEPTQEIECLVNTQTMELRLPGENSRISGPRPDG